ncbi:thermonuclease family protein [Thermaerobacter composti]|uniref:Thermonuclease family protein n=1 Tax=Thermaerobacter composti TaxID=554949 RepID=A0ABZ0QLR1_9FIRM|nr:thermonuclease family protein [Thermaerobacter composti]PZN06285.1 MAG: nuclease [Bacillota bacterium]WPD18435.1 thermonuclease family protein [Thermaerobacter composti]
MRDLAVCKLGRCGVPARARAKAAALLVALVLAVALGAAGCGTETEPATPAGPGSSGVAPSGRDAAADDGTGATEPAAGAAGESAEGSTGTGAKRDSSPSSGRLQPAAERQRPGLTRARVVDVIDGDTLEVEPLGGAPLPSTRVRLIGVNTPEVHGEVEPYGPEAARFTRRHLAGRVVWLEKDVSETDRYGRALRYVWLVEPPERPTPAHVREGMFNAILLLEGYAQVVTYPPDVRYADLFVRFQREAREAERGLWGLRAASGGRYGAGAADGGSSQPGSGAIRTAGARDPAPVGRRGGCDPAYPDVCIPSPPPDLDCGDIPYRDFRVLPPDPHRLDGWDRDGVGCER